MKFDHSLPHWKVQEVEVATQSEFVAIKQFDGGGADTLHWVLVRKSQIPDLISVLQRAQATNNDYPRMVVGTVVDTATEEGQ